MSQAPAASAGGPPAGSRFLATALAVELADEVVDGTQGAAMPLIRHALALSYGQVGLLTAVPLFVGNLLEVPLGVLAGTGRTRRWVTRAGGLVFAAAVLAASAAPSYGWLLAAFAVYYPASGAFVSLTQSQLMDADPDRHSQHMVRWTIAGAIGAVAGPLLLSAVVAAGGGWRVTYGILGTVTAAAWLGVTLTRAPSAPEPGAGPVRRRLPRPAQVRRQAVALRRRAAALPRRVADATAHREAVRWVIALRVADLLLDVFTGYLALYLVDVVHVSPSAAALAVALRLGASLAGYAALLPALERIGWPGRLLRLSAVATAVLYPAFLLLPGLAVKLVLVVALSVATAPWYPLMQAQLYRSLPGRSDVAVSLAAAAGLAGSLAPLAVGALAQRFGLSWAMGSLALVPVGVLAAVPRGRPAPSS